MARSGKPQRQFGVFRRTATERGEYRLFVSSCAGGFADSGGTPGKPRQHFEKKSLREGELAWQRP
jgi:hypothetical protein